jgi:hypothetical protein
MAHDIKRSSLTLVLCTSVSVISSAQVSANITEENKHGVVRASFEDRLNLVKSRYHLLADRTDQAVPSLAIRMAGNDTDSSISGPSPWDDWSNGDRGWSGAQ